MLSQVKRAIEPALSLKGTIDHWQNIACGLAEPPRKRKSQVSKIQVQAQTS